MNDGRETAAGDELKVFKLREDMRAAASSAAARLSGRARPDDKAQPAAWRYWLYPATYAVHILEELWGGEGFTAWLARVAAVELSTRQFLVWNALALLLMLVGVPLALRFRRLRWLLAACGVAFLLNTLSHLAASLYTISYSPGLLSGLLLWVPLGAWTLLHFKKTLGRRGFRAGLLVGLLMHAAVLALTLFGGRLHF